MDPALVLQAACLRASCRLNRFDHRRRGAFLPLTGHEGDTLVLFQRFVAITLNFREMGEEVFATQLRHDKAEALVVVKPLHDTSFNLQCKS